jgi:Ca2+-binding EF-hand superfamily protein
MTPTRLLTLALFAIGCAAPAMAQQAESASPEANVTVTSHPGNSISPNYHVDFAAMDANGDGSITRAEARGNPDLMREFHVVDTNHDGRLGRGEMKGWTD